MFEEKVRVLPKWVIVDLELDSEGADERSLHERFCSSKVRAKTSAAVNHTVLEKRRIRDSSCLT